MTGRSFTAALAGMLLSAATARADVVLEWNAVALETLVTQNPFAQSRYAAITQLAVFEAVNAITRDHEAYLGTIEAPDGASAEAAAVAAAHAVLRSYVPASATALDAARAASLAEIPDGPAKADGIAVGESAASAMIALRANDGSAPPAFYVAPAPLPGAWQPTPGCSPAGGALLHWSGVTPFGIENADQFRPDPPPALTSRRYAKDYDEVKRVGAAGSAERPPDRADVARLYATVPAAVAWNLAARQVSAAQGRSLAENARAFALLNMAIADALVAVFDAKYHYTFWRPQTAIRAGDTDGHPGTEADAGYTPFLATPCFPGYPSAHATAAYAARRVAERAFGAGGHSITVSTPALPDVAVHYTTFKQIAEDIDDARVYAGMHFRFDQEAGARQGRRVGAYVYRHNLRRVRGGDEE